MKKAVSHKLTALLLSLLMLLAVIPVTAVADGDSFVHCTDVLSDYVELDVLKADLISQLAAGVERVDLKKYNLPFNNEIQLALTELVFKNLPEVFQIQNSLSYSYTGNSESLIITSLNPSYLYTPEQYSTMLAECEAAAEKLLDGIIGNDSLSDVEKALLIHDRLVCHCEYDLTYSNYDIYGALVNRVTVCEGYTKAYIYLLDKVGIKSVYINSDALNHAWNLVYIDGKVYHVDVTWDDPIYDVTGRVKHVNFLRSASGIVETGHTADDFDMSCTNTEYDSYYWQSSNAEFLLLNGKIYYIDSANAKLMDTDGNVLCDVADKWLADESHYWTENMSRLSSDGYELFYTSAASVFAFDPKTGESRVLFTPESEPYFSIFGFTYENGMLICDMYNNPQYDSATKALYQRTMAYEREAEVVITPEDILPDGITIKDGYLVGFAEKTAVGTLNPEYFTVYASDGKKKESGNIGTGDRIVALDKNGETVIEAVAVVRGDVARGDGVANTQDYIAVRLHILNKPLTNENFLAADIDGNGTVNAKDYIALRIHILKATPL